MSDNNEQHHQHQHHQQQQQQQQQQHQQQQQQQHHHNQQQSHLHHHQQHHLGYHPNQQPHSLHQQQHVQLVDPQLQQSFQSSTHSPPQSPSHQASSHPVDSPSSLVNPIANNLNPDSGRTTPFAQAHQALSAQTQSPPSSSVEPTGIVPSANDPFNVAAFSSSAPASSLSAVDGSSNVNSNGPQSGSIQVTATHGCSNCFSLQQKYIAALESVATLNHRITSLIEEKSTLSEEKTALQGQVFQLHQAQQFAQAQAAHQAQQQQILQQQQHHIAQLQQPGPDASSLDPTHPSGSVVVASGNLLGTQQLIGTGGHARYQPSLPISIPEDRLEIARKQYGSYDPYKDIDRDELEMILSVTPNWTADHQTRKAIWSELTNRHGIPVMRKMEPGEDPKEYALERQKSAEWAQISQTARSIARELLVPGRTWFDQTDEAQKLAIKACQLKVEQTRWCENNWKAVVLLDSRLVEWNRAWREKNEDPAGADPADGDLLRPTKGGRRKRRRSTETIIAFLGRPP
ncbi:hypothetical protein [Phaffia rhodozyma]|uniref:Uncharacterized protein n=1 Tax=Phaffia rhodozyma TaxID=264483 RepID=A0A0F7SEK0_PHARH|nr:hypothetical protein [Phaffia rhodozyma]